MVPLAKDLEIKLVRMADSEYTFNGEPTDCWVFEEYEG